MKKTLPGIAIGVRHAAVITADITRALKFYGDVLEFESYHTGDPDWAMVKQAGTTLSLIRGTPEAYDGGGGHRAHIGWIVNTPDTVDRFHERIEKAGSKVGEKKKHRDGSYGFYFEDPDRNLLECIFIPYSSDTESNREGIVLLAHGSRDPQWCQTLENLRDRVALHAGDRVCELAFLESASPNLADVVGKLAKDPKVEKIRVVPVFVAAGGHYGSDIVPLVADLRKKFPQRKIELDRPLGESPWVQEAMVAVVLRT